MVDNFHVDNPSKCFVAYDLVDKFLVICLHYLCVDEDLAELLTFAPYYCFIGINLIFELN